MRAYVVLVTQADGDMIDEIFSTRAGAGRFVANAEASDVARTYGFEYRIVEYEVDGYFGDDLTPADPDQDGLASQDRVATEVPES